MRNSFDRTDRNPQAKQVQLFDLKKDPWETRNLAAERGYDVLKSRLYGLLREQQKHLEDPLAR